MKVISLNTWGGIGDAHGLLEFFKKHQDVDIFCLQEVFSGGESELAKLADGMEGKLYDMFTQIRTVLPNHVGYFRPHLQEYYGLALFVKTDISVLEEGEHFVHKERGFIPSGDVGNHARNIQYIKFEHNGTIHYVVNFHGLWNGKGKTDCEERIEQSTRMAKAITGLVGEKIVCGDFNLLPTTESLKIVEDLGLKNLIKEFGITSTRTSHYTKPEKYADYALVSSRVKVKEFKVLPDEVSDHAPLYLEID